MGFLNHSTNNIIVDAVLTEKGREALSRNDGSFNITQFRFGDDEVDYSILKQYGLIIGKEKIEKNTPIFEAITDESTGLKYKLRTLTSNNTNDIFAFPYLKTLDSLVTPVALSSNSSSKTSKTKIISFKTFVNQDETFSLDNVSELKDTEFEVKVFNKLLRVSNNKPYADPQKNNVDCYTIYPNSDSNVEDFSGQVFGSFSISAIGVVTNSTYQFYATSGNSSLIKTQVQITGNNTGSTLIVPVTITSDTIS